MRFAGAVGIGLLLAACSSSSDTLDGASEATTGGEVTAGRELASIPENIYQPTVHGILALSGGFDDGDSVQPIVTVWRRAGTEQSVRIPLSPDDVNVQALHAGRYVLDSLVVDGRELVVTGDDDRKQSPVSDVVLDPGDVIYGGDLIVRQRKSDQASTGKKRNMVLRIQSSAERARRAIAKKYSRQAAKPCRRGCCASVEAPLTKPTWPRTDPDD